MWPNWFNRSLLVYHSTSSDGSYSNFSWLQPIATLRYPANKESWVASFGSIDLSICSLRSGPALECLLIESIPWYIRRYDSVWRLNRTPLREWLSINRYVGWNPEDVGLGKTCPTSCPKLSATNATNNQNWTIYTNPSYKRENYWYGKWTVSEPTPRNKTEADKGLKLTSNIPEVFATHRGSCLWELRSYINRPGQEHSVHEMGVIHATISFAVQLKHVFFCSRLLNNTFMDQSWATSSDWLNSKAVQMDWSGRAQFPWISCYHEPTMNQQWTNKYHHMVYARLVRWIRNVRSF